jgi:hypothetical protein
MKDRVRIMLGNQEIVKRYIGSRLVWEAVKKTTERLLLTIRARKLWGSSSVLIINTSNTNTPTILKPKKIQADNKPPINLESLLVTNVKETGVVLIFATEDKKKRVENYVSGATIIKFYGE